MTHQRASASYTEITVEVVAGDAERAGDLLRIVTGSSPWIDTPFEQRDLESDAALSPHGRAVVRAYVSAFADGAGLVHRMRDALAMTGLEGTVRSASVCEQDWADAWKAYFDVERHGEHIVVVPSWRRFAPSPDDVVIELDPGMAFGTGQHETTRMCLEALERRVTPGSAVLDVGSGSGILSIAAAKLGAREVYALDIDPDCARITAENARLNGVDSIVRARAGSLGDAWPFAGPPAARFDLIVANIIARPIIDLAADFHAALRPGGRLIASGIIAAREGEVTGALDAAGLRVDDVRSMGDWRCIEAVRT